MTYILGNAPTAEFRLQLLDELTSPPFVKAVKKLLPKQNMRIVILGCGSGHLEARLAQIFSNCHFIGIDISKARLAEAKARVVQLTTTNTFEFIEGDLTKMEPIACDILISRFVLSHLQDPEAVLAKFSSSVRSRGYVCIEEGASDGKEYYSNTRDVGYESFVRAVDIQIQAQKSHFDTSLKLFSNPPGKVIHRHITQPILDSARTKSILRLGLQEAPHLVTDSAALISALHAFEQDDKAYGLYMRYLAFITQIT